MEKRSMTEPTLPHQKQPLALAESVRRVFHQGSVEIVAVSNASFSILPGERIAIIGPSGSGKSTLLNLLADLDQPTSGSLSWPALDNRSNLRPTQISFAMQIPGLLPPLTVVENVAIPLLLTETAPEDAQASAYQMLEALDLADLAFKLPEELSGGQAQRVALARALVTHPRLILTDEPTGQLDHPTAQRMFDRIFTVIAGWDTALLVATHDLSIAERLDKVWKIQQGVVLNVTH
jgi:putative ABC transport system ATP-binding protein/lipoprotein-releasing system ATP-binding protein